MYLFSLSERTEWIIKYVACWIMLLSTILPISVGINAIIRGLFPIGKIIGFVMFSGAIYLLILIIKMKKEASHKLEELQ